MHPKAFCGHYSRPVREERRECTKTLNCRMRELETKIADINCQINLTTHMHLSELTEAMVIGELEAKKLVLKDALHKLIEEM